MSKNSVTNNNEAANNIKLAAKDEPSDNLKAKDKKAELKNISPSSLRAKSLAERQKSLIKQEMGEVPVRKPSKQRFFIIKDGEEWQAEYDVIELKDDKEYYVLTNDYIPPADLLDDTKRIMINLGQYIDDGSVFLMPTTIPNPGDEDKKWASWSRSQFRCIEMAKKVPIRMKAVMSEGGYRPFVSEIPADVPPLPEGKVFDDFIMRAFEGRIVDSNDHAIVKKLRRKKQPGVGEVVDWGDE